MAGKKDAITNKKNKPRLSLIPKEALYELGHALTYGEDKYGTHNYKEGIKLSYWLDAAMRHINQFNDGEDIDVESDNHHLGHALASLAIAVDTFYNRPEYDDRYKKEVKIVEEPKDDLVETNCITGTIIKEDDMMYILRGSTLYKKDGRTINIDVNGTYPVKRGDRVST